VKLAQTSKILLTVLYGVSLIYFSVMILGGSESELFDEIISMLFYVATIVATLKGFADLVTRKEKSDIIFLILSVLPLMVWMMYLILSTQLI
jgi:hypothetical protein